MAALSQTAANVIPATGASKKTVVAGGTVTAGMPVYKDTADSDEYKACRANAAGTANCDGIALNGASDGQPLEIQTTGGINLGATLTVGETYCVSDAVAGQIVPIGDLGSTDYVTVLGIATTASNLKMAINNSGVQKP